MKEVDDITCLRRFAATRDDAAFATLVGRHINLVYSSALRQTHDIHMAEDVSQAVFTILARKAGDLAQTEPVLSAWLLVVTRLSAMNALKLAARRRRHERIAAEINTMSSTAQSASVWSQIEPDLDRALASLRDADRRAIALRYFEDRSLPEIGRLLGISEDAAKQRVFRAVEKLRALLGGKSGSIPAASLTTAIAAHAVHAAPSNLAATITASAISASSATTLALVKGVLKLMLYAKIKNAAVAAAVFLLLAGSAVVVIQQVTKDDTRAGVTALPLTQAAAVANPTPPAGWRERLDDVYRLADGQVLKLVSPPYIPERKILFDSYKIDAAMMRDPSKGVFVFEWHGTAQFNRWNNGNSDVGSIIWQVVHMPRYRYEMDERDRQRDVPGDWVIRPNATTDELMAALAQVFKERADWPVKFEKTQVERDLYIARGAFKPDEKIPVDQRIVDLYLDQKKRYQSMHAGNVSDFLIMVGEMMNHEIIDETTTPSAHIWSKNFVGPSVTGRFKDVLLDHITDQTDINFHIEKRTTTLWTTSLEARK